MTAPDAMDPALAGLLLVGAASLGAIAWATRARARREQRDREALAQSVALGRNHPPTLHPVINADRCIGSLSCLSACPQGDILGLVDGRAVLLDAAACIGHGTCALECPVDAIRLVFGTSERGLDLPELSDTFEASRVGVHVVGELSGMGLIKNGMKQGLELAEHLAAALKADSRAEATDVVIVGAGPAGLATALGCAHAGLTYRLLDQEDVGGAVRHYPRHKVVMMEPVRLPGYGWFGRRVLSKEELLDLIHRVVARCHLRVEPGVRAEGLTGSDGAFTLETTAGPITARKVVLATGRSGTPRKLGVPGEERASVVYRLLDAEEFAQARVLVVGGGDSALEAAQQLAEQPGTEVTLSYRGQSFTRCRDANRRQVEALAAQGRVRLLLASTVEEVLEGEVRLRHEGAPVTQPFDAVVACLGGELPVALLEKLGVAVKRYFGTAPGDDQVALARASAERRKLSRLEQEQRSQARFALTLFAVGVTILATLVVVGWDYYLLPAELRELSPKHALLRPAGLWGHGIGVVATLFMLSNFLYAARKRWRRAKGGASIRRWLTFHQFVGLMSAPLMCFHAAFLYRNVLALVTTGTLVLVVFSGVIGRFFFWLVPSTEGRVDELPAVLARWERLKARLLGLAAPLGEASAPHRAAAALLELPPPRSLPRELLGAPFAWLGAQRAARRLRPAFSSEPDFHAFAQVYREAALTRLQLGAHRGLKQLLAAWRYLHVVLAVALVVLMLGHIAFSFFIGFRWLLTPL